MCKALARGFTLRLTTSAIVCRTWMTSQSQHRRDATQLRQALDNRPVNNPHGPPLPPPRGPSSREFSGSPLRPRNPASRLAQGVEKKPSGRLCEAFAQNEVAGALRHTDFASVSANGDGGGGEKLFTGKTGKTGSPPNGAQAPPGCPSGPSHFTEFQHNALVCTSSETPPPQFKQTHEHRDSAASRCAAPDIPSASETRDRQANSAHQKGQQERGRERRCPCAVEKEKMDVPWRGGIRWNVHRPVGAHPLGALGPCLRRGAGRGLGKSSLSHMPARWHGRLSGLSLAPVLARNSAPIDFGIAVEDNIMGMAAKAQALVQSLFLSRRGSWALAVTYMSRSTWR
ncbi:hypothetical protein VDGL01_11744 [Verticillium dahliae]